MHELIFWLITALWLVEFLYRKKQNITSDASPSIQDRFTFPLILSSLVITIATTIIFSSLHIGKVHYGFTWFGLVLYACGVSLRWWGIMVLGQFFTRDVIVNHTMKLVSSGPYRLLRHPLYTGILFCSIGISFSLGTWLGVVATMIFVVPSLLIRINIEERSLHEVLGSAYRTWCLKRWRLIPFLY